MRAERKTESSCVLAFHSSLIPSMCYFVIIFRVFVFFGLSDAGRGGFPAQTAPFFFCAEKLKSGQGVCGVALKSQALCHDLQLLSFVAEDHEANAAAHIRQLALQVDERAIGSNVLGCPFSNDVLARFRVPLGAHQQGGEVARSCPLFCKSLSGHLVSLNAVISDE